MKKKTKKAAVAAKEGLRQTRQNPKPMPFGAATFILVASTAITYFVLSNGAPYLPSSFITAGALGIETLPFGAVTYLFIHAGLGHLLENLVGLAVFCLVAEAALSYKDALAIYFLSGIAGGLAFVLVSPQMKIIGASAGIVGLAVAGLLADPKKGILALAFVALAVNWAAPQAADWVAKENYKNLEQQKQLAEQAAQELAAAQKPAEAQQQLSIAQERQQQLDAQAEAKKREAASGTADAAHVAGAAVGALYVIAFRRGTIYAWMKDARRLVAKIT